MYENISLKSIATFLFWTSVIIGGIGFFYGIAKYSDAFYDEKSMYISTIVYSVVFIIVGIITSYLFLGFAVLIEKVSSIEKALCTSKTVVSNEVVDYKVKTENKELTRAELYDKLNNKID